MCGISCTVCGISTLSVYQLGHQLGHHFVEKRWTLICAGKCVAIEISTIDMDKLIWSSKKRWTFICAVKCVCIEISTLIEDMLIGTTDKGLRNLSPLETYP